MNWKLCLAVLTCNVLFMSSSYTMIIPFLPVYLTKELGVIPADIHLWSGIIFFRFFHCQLRYGSYLGAYG